MDKIIVSMIMVKNIRTVHEIFFQSSADISL